MRDGIHWPGTRIVKSRGNAFDLSLPAQTPRTDLYRAAAGMKGALASAARMPARPATRAPR